MYKILCLLILLFSHLVFAQNVILNEIMPSNQITIYDDDGDTPDWIELYNSSNATVDLSGFALSDDSLEIQKWQFGQASIKPDQHLIVFASDKDRPTVLNHWETVIREGDLWKYKIGDATIPANWKDPSYDASTWAEGPSGFGYSDDDDATDLSAQSPFISLFIRTTFSVSNVNAIMTGVLDAFYDDGFVAYLNGTEIARAEMGTAGEQPAWDATAESHEAFAGRGFPPERFDIDDICELLVNGENVIAIEVHNASSNSSDMSIIPYLSLGMTETPANPLNSPEILELDASLAYLHTNFKISAGGESVLFSDASGTVIDQVNVPASEGDVSYGRENDTSPTWIFQLPTPGAANQGETIYGLADNVVMSNPGGFYNSAVTVALSAGDSRIFYTQDGSDPDSTDTEYTAPIQIQQTTVLKAIALKPNYLPGPLSCHTYFINEQTDLPVISLSSDPYNLFNSSYGIYTNFTQDWERPAYVEFFEDDQSPGFSENCGIEIFGSQSANWDQKSISVKFKGQYGVSEIDYPLFPDFDLTTFKSFVLRNSGNDWQYTHIRDAMMQELVKDLDVDYLEYRPATTYINGEYWGIYNIREKINEHYIANRHGVDPDNIDLLENNMDVIHGDTERYQQLIDYLSTKDMTTDSAYIYLDSEIDLDEWLLYFGAQAYYNNMDWPGTNIKFWRERNNNGKWRWILFGLDFGFGLYAHGAWEDHIAFMFSPVETRYSNKPWATLLQRKMIENPVIRNRFINQVADLLNTNFQSERVVNIINTLSDHISNEITRHRSRWNLGGETTEKLLTFANERPEYLRTHMRNFFQCSNDGVITVNASNGGKIKLNTLYFNPDELPWSGTYFQGNDVQLKAIPAPGYKFDSWSGAVNSTDPSISVSVGAASNISASFSVDDRVAKEIVINEINYSSAETFDCGDWIEFYNRSDCTIDMSHWVFSDSNSANQFVFPAGTSLKPDQYLVLVENSGDFSGQFPDVRNFLGRWDFGLSGTGEALSLHDEEGQLIDSLTYDDEVPWPVDIAGSGATLKLNDPDLDNALAVNWSASDKYGSPGLHNSFVSPVELKESNGQKQQFVLRQNYPNPFNPTTQIQFSIPEKSFVSLKVYSMLGEEITELAGQDYVAGMHSVMFNASGYASGIYYYSLTAGNQSVTKKMIIIK